MEPSTPFAQRFSDYFAREVAQKAANSISDGAEMEFAVLGSDGQTVEHFTFTKSGGRNLVKPGQASDPQLAFTLTQAAAEKILSDASNEIGAIGVNIARMIVSPDASHRVTVKFKAGFLSLFSKGYFGVITSGGGQFASFLASKGLNGMSAIKAALKKVKE